MEANRTEQFSYPQCLTLISTLPGVKTANQLDLIGVKLICIFICSCGQSFVSGPMSAVVWRRLMRHLTQHRPFNGTWEGFSFSLPDLLWMVKKRNHFELINLWKLLNKYKSLIRSKWFMYKLVGLVTGGLFQDYFSYCWINKQLTVIIYKLHV